MKSFRILSLDGGGARGLLSARLLSNMEKQLNEISGNEMPLGRRFDLIVGTSTGAILAAGLASGMTASCLFRQYQCHLEEIFSPVSLSWWRAKYQTEPLRKVLASMLKNQKLEKLSQPHLCIVAVDAQTGRPRLYKSGYLLRNKPRLNLKLVDVVLGSAAAPTYFPLVKGEDDVYMADGGLCANNPAMVGVIDALEIFKEERSVSKDEAAKQRGLNDVVVVSVGTGVQPGLPYSVSKKEKAGKLGWIKKGALFEMMFMAQSDLVAQQLKLLLGERQLRLNPILPRPVPLDNLKALQGLGGLLDLNREQVQWLRRFIL